MVGGINGEAAGIADRSRVHALGLPEFSLRAPETTHTEHAERHAVKCALERGSADMVSIGYRHPL